MALTVEYHAAGWMVTGHVDYRGSYPLLILVADEATGKQLKAKLKRGVEAVTAADLDPRFSRFELADDLLSGAEATADLCPSCGCDWDEEDEPHTADCQYVLWAGMAGRELRGTVAP